MADLRNYLTARDLDTGAGSDLILGVNLRLSASGGSIEALGQKAMASSIPVTIASDQSALSVTLSSAVVDTELPSAAALADGASNPTTPLVGACLLGFNGTSWDRVYTVANAASYAAGTKGLLILGQNSTTDYRALSVDSTGKLNVNTTSAVSPTNKYVTSAALAAGASANLDTGDLGAVKLAQVEVWTTVAYKAFVYTVSNGTPSTDPVVVGGGQAFQGFSWKAPATGYVSVASSAGVDGFRVAVTNLDDTNAADVYASFHYET